MRGPCPRPGEDGYTGYERLYIRLELAFLACDETGAVYTPLAHGRGDWPSGSFGDTQTELDGIRSRIVGLASLIEDKAGPRDDRLPGRMGRIAVSRSGLWSWPLEDAERVASWVCKDN